MKKKKMKIKPLHPFKTLNEEAKFWDTHDTSSLFKDSRTHLSKLPKIEPAKDFVKDEILTIRVQSLVKEKIKEIARIKGLNPTTLARMWLMEKLSGLSRNT